MTSEKSDDPAVPAVAGENTAGGDGVVGIGGRGVVGKSADYQGVYGHSGTNAGVVGEADAFHGVFGISHDTHNAGLFGTNDSPGGLGVIGIAQHGDGIGVDGVAPNIGVRGTGRQGVVGLSTDYQGVYGHSVENAGVVGESDQMHAVYGVSRAAGFAGVYGTNTVGGDGVVGIGRRGVVGDSTDYQGVYGHSVENAGVVGESDRMHAVFAISHSPTSAGVFATNTAGGQAALIEGDCVVTGDLILAGADVAEQFDVADAVSVDDGAVVIVDDEGRLSTTEAPYDSRVVGIVSGAGDRVPALVLDRPPAGGQPPDGGPWGPRQQLPLAVVGKAWCLADAGGEPIRVGDLLTTSARAGHAMRASDRSASFGAVIGKALTPLAGGAGLVLALVGLG